MASVSLTCIRVSLHMLPLGGGKRLFSVFPRFSLLPRVLVFSRSLFCLHTFLVSAYRLVDFKTPTEQTVAEEVLHESVLNGTVTAQ